VSAPGSQIVPPEKLPLPSSVMPATMFLPVLGVLISLPVLSKLLTSRPQYLPPQS
jgi:hypothetical protein